MPDEPPGMSAALSTSALVYATREGRSSVLRLERHTEAPERLLLSLDGGSPAAVHCSPGI